MGGEPWCFHPAQIADLTDFQIHHVYVLPAVKRARKESEKMNPHAPTAIAGTSAKPAHHVGPTVEELGETPDEVVELYVSMGLSRETAKRMAAEQLGGS